ncbi:MAG: transposase, partial [Synergistaceae bacterium]
APREHSSGTSVFKKSKISRRGNSRIRHHLYMATLAAARVNPVIKEVYERLLHRGTCKKLAFVACMRKMLHIIWGVMKNRKHFDPCYSLK